MRNVASFSYSHSRRDPYDHFNRIAILQTLPVGVHVTPHARDVVSRIAPPVARQSGSVMQSIARSGFGVDLKEVDDLDSVLVLDDLRGKSSCQELRIGANRPRIPLFLACLHPRRELVGGRCFSFHAKHHGVKDRVIRHGEL